MDEGKTIECSGCGHNISGDSGPCHQCGITTQPIGKGNTFIESTIVNFPVESDSLDYFDKRYNSPRRR